MVPRHPDGPHASTSRAALFAAVLALVGGACGSGTSSATDLSASDGPRDLTVADLVVAPDLAGICAGDFADCTSFTDLTAPAADRTVTFANYAYSPKCLRMKVGQTVVFSGDFAVHPLRQACGPAPVFTGDGGPTHTFAPSLAGRYGFYCLDHGSADGKAMAGAIDVAP